MTVLKGECVAPGVALGTIRLLGFDDEAGFPTRIPADQVDEELNLLRRGVEQSRGQLEDLRARHEDSLGQSELRIFDVHLALLDDPMFVAAIEKMVVDERFSVRAAIRKVAADYDRIFELVEDDYLRERASDFRDVAERVQRNITDAQRMLGGAPTPTLHPEPEGHYVLGARRLRVNDLFKLDNERVDGIVTEEGGISSHAGILARSMGIPTITGIRDLASKVEDGAFVVVDAGSGELHVHPDARLRAEYETAAARHRDVAGAAAAATGVPHTTRDGAPVEILGACGNLSEVELARTFGMDGVGVYRTELLFLVEARKPTEDVLVHHYSQVLQQSALGPAWFRLLDVTSHSQVPWLHAGKERNPALGQRGIRSLLLEAEGLRLQIRALLRAAAGRERAGLLVPFVTSVTELQRVRAAVLEERQALRKAGLPCAEVLEFAPIVEVPAAAFVGRALLNEADMLVVSVDDLQALLVAADRDNPGVRDYYAMYHPAMFELLHRLAQDAAELEKPLTLFGELAAQPELMPFYLGVGIRSFAIAPAHAAGVLEQVHKLTVDECQRTAEQLLQAPRALDVQRILLTSADRRAARRGRPRSGKA